MCFARFFVCTFATVIFASLQHSSKEGAQCMFKLNLLYSVAAKKEPTSTANGLRFLLFSSLPFWFLLVVSRQPPPTTHRLSPFQHSATVRWASRGGLRRRVPTLASVMLDDCGSCLWEFPTSKPGFPPARKSGRYG